MQIEIANYHPHKIIEVIAERLKVKSANDCMEQTLLIPEKYGEGQISGFHFGNSLGIMIFNLKLKEELELTFYGSVPPLQFHFLMEGEVHHCFNNNMIRYQLAPLQGSITANPEGTTEKFYLPANTALLFTKLSIDRAEYMEKIDCLIEGMPTQLNEVFSDVKAGTPFIYQTNYSISIAETIKKIASDNNEGLIRSTLIEGKALELLSRQIKQFNDDLLAPEKQVVLREHDINKIEAARDIMLKNIKNPPTIEELAKLAGINRQKLKYGFKRLFGKTINNYLREERLEMASLLLLSGKTIVECVNAVGYSNQSHFARRFKEKYGVLPKDYKKNIQTKIEG